MLCRILLMVLAGGAQHAPHSATHNKDFDPNIHAQDLYERGRLSSDAIQVEGIRCGQPVIYDNLVICEGDIVVGKISQWEDREIYQWEGREIRNQHQLLAIEVKGKHWDCPIPWENDDADEGHVEAAIAHWERYTDWRFKERDGERDYIKFKESDGCSSRVGKSGGSQDIYISDRCAIGNVIHEIGHALGFHHEHARLDRDEYIDVDWSNVDSDYTGNFDSRDSDSANDIGEYDYGSIMHYAPNTFASPDSATTIHILRDTDATVGQRIALSELDIEAANFRAIGHCTSPTEQPSEPPSQPPIQPPTQHPSEPPSQPPTDPPTEPPTKPTGPATETPTGPASIECNLSEGWLRGDTLSTLPSLDQDECCDECFADSTCFAYTWRDSSSPVCILMSSVTSVLKRSRYLYQIMAERCSISAGLIHGQPLQTTDTNLNLITSISGCCDICSQTPDCVAWTFKQSIARCELKSSVEDITTYQDPGWVYHINQKALCCYSEIDADIYGFGQFQTFAADLETCKKLCCEDQVFGCQSVQFSQHSTLGAQSRCLFHNTTITVDARVSGYLMYLKSGCFGGSSSLFQGASNVLESGE